MAGLTVCQAVDNRGQEQRENGNPDDRMGDAAMVFEVACRPEYLPDNVNIRKIGRNHGCGRSMGRPAANTCACQCKADKRMGRIEHAGRRGVVGPSNRTSTYDSIARSP